LPETGSKGNAVRLNDNFNDLGFIIIGVFILAWLVSFVIYRMKGYDELPVIQGIQNQE
jgi:hypothetical protein